MPHGVHARGLEHVEEVTTPGQCPPHEPVDVARGEQVGVEVVAAEHAAIGMRVDERSEGLEIAGGRTLADQDPHSQPELLQRLVECHALVIGRDAGNDVGSERPAGKPGGVPVDRLAAGLGRRELREHVRVARHHARIVHHLREIADVGAVEQGGHARGVECRAGMIERRGRHARRGTEAEVKGTPPGIVQHELDAGNAEHVGDLMWVRYGRDSAVGHRHAGKLARWEERAFHVHVGIDEPG